MEATYHLLVHGIASQAVRISSFCGREAMNTCYELTIECVADASRDIPGSLLGRRATLVMNVGESPSVIHGLIHSVNLLGYGRGDRSRQIGDISATYSLSVGPRLWLLKKTRRSRVFQGKRVDQIVKEILHAVGRFQQQHGLSVTGYPDDPTRKALVSAHGG